MPTVTKSFILDAPLQVVPILSRRITISQDRDHIDHAEEPAAIMLLPTDQAAGGAVAADGSVWFTESKANRIGHMSPSGAITEIAVPTASAGLNGIAIAPDGNVWFTETASGKIGYVTP